MELNRYQKAAKTRRDNQRRLKRVRDALSLIDERLYVNEWTLPTMSTNVTVEIYQDSSNIISFELLNRLAKTFGTWDITTNIKAICDHDDDGITELGVTVYTTLTLTSVSREFCAGSQESL